MTDLPLHDPVALTAALVDIPSVSGGETAIADAVEAALASAPHLEVLRDGDAVVARTHLGRPHRVVVAGHLDTVPIVDNVPSERIVRHGAPHVRGRGSVDMKAGVAVALHLALTLDSPRHDVTWVFYDHEEVAAELNGLGRLVEHHPDWLAGDFAVLGEPTSAGIEGGCNGTLRVRATFPGRAAHSARAWRGENAIHALAPVLTRLATFGHPEVEVDGLTYRESLLAVGVSGGRAGNVVPDSAELLINYRFAPSRTGAEALEVVEGVLAGSGARVEVDDLAEGARPGMDTPLAAELIDALGRVRASRGMEGAVPLSAKVGWTDVARFSALGIPAVNLGPGDPLDAHTEDEAVPEEDVVITARAFEAWLTGTVDGEREGAR